VIPAHKSQAFAAGTHTTLRNRILPNAPKPAVNRRLGRSSRSTQYCPRRRRGSGFDRRYDEAALIRIFGQVIGNNAQNGELIKLFCGSEKSPIAAVTDRNRNVRYPACSDRPFVEHRLPTTPTPLLAHMAGAAIATQQGSYGYYKLSLSLAIEISPLRGPVLGDSPPMTASPRYRKG
jgi:hypothetical protein